jgi:hypothetical protein
VPIKNKIEYTSVKVTTIVKQMENGTDDGRNGGMTEKEKNRGRTAGDERERMNKRKSIERIFGRCGVGLFPTNRPADSLRFQNFPLFIKYSLTLSCLCSSTPLLGPCTAEHSMASSSAGGAVLCPIFHV